MWDTHPQHTIGATESGKPIGFHYSEGEDGAGKFNRLDHHEAATLHDRKRNVAAQRAAEYDKQGMKGAANGFRKLAAHHAKQSSMHMAKVLPAAQKQPQTRTPNVAQTSRKEAVQPRTPYRPKPVAGQQVTPTPGARVNTTQKVAPTPPKQVEPTPGAPRKLPPSAK